MPKLRDTPQQRRDKAFRGALDRGLSENEITDKVLADKLGVTNVTVSRWRGGQYPKMTLERFAELAARVGMTGQEVCRIIGVPYKEEST
ncbi:hypothetical protein QVN85_06780 [Oscillibacter valericigenes]|uniref:hypothetical protein n=1 Tax=Oscillibacter ruminantium TaxID=1263547 RepID=UPI0025AA89BA|nr:hypothetical protein [Oscillibacter valericigenes]